MTTANKSGGPPSGSTYGCENRIEEFYDVSICSRFGSKQSTLEAKAHSDLEIVNDRVEVRPNLPYARCSSFVSILHICSVSNHWRPFRQRDPLPGHIRTHATAF